MKKLKVSIFVLVFLLLGGMVVLAEKPGVEEKKDPLEGWEQVLLDTSMYKKDPPFTIGFDMYWLGNSWSVQFAEEFKYEASLHKDLIGEMVITDSEGEVSKQVNNIEDLVARNVDVIVVTQLSESALIPVLKKAKAKGIPVIASAIFLETDEAKELFVTNVSCDAVEFGRVIAEWLVEEIDGKGNIIALSGLAGVTNAESRWKGAMSVFENYPNIKILAREYADWSYPKGKQVTASLLPAYPEIDGVWSGGAAMTRGAMEAFMEAGRPLVPMTGEDNNGFMKLWLDHRSEGFSSIAAAAPTYQGSEACRLALKVLQGEPVYNYYVVRVPIITDDDLDKYVRPDLPDSFWIRTRLPESKIKELFTE